MYEQADTPEGWITRLRCAKCGTVGVVVHGVGRKYEKIARARLPVSWGLVRDRGKVTSLRVCPSCK